MTPITGGRSDRRGDDKHDEVDPSEVLAWLRGELDPTALRRFEKRAAADPKFLEEAIEIAEADVEVGDLVDVVVPLAKRVRVKRGLSLGVAAAVAAAVILSSVIVLWRWGGPRSDPLFLQVASMPSPAALNLWQAEYGFDPAFVVPRGAIDRSETPPDVPRVSAPEFVSRTMAVARERAEALLRDGIVDIEAGHYRIPIRVNAPADVMVFEVRRGGEVRRVWPRPASNSARIPANEIVMLPDPPVRSVDVGTPLERVEYQPGFLVEPGMGDLDVVVAVIGENAEWSLVDVDALSTGRRTAAELGRELEKRGFTVRSLRVRELPL